MLMPQIPEPKPFDKITKSDFTAYEDIRQMGMYNMFDPAARRLSGLDPATYRGVMRNYTELCIKFPDVREGARRAK